MTAAAWVLILLTASPAAIPFFNQDSCKAAIAEVHRVQPDLGAVCVLRGVQVL